MKKGNRRLTRGVAFLVTLLVVAIGGSFAQTAVKSAGGYKVTLLTSADKWKDVYKDMAAAIKDDYNITVEFQTVPSDQYFSLVRVKLASGETPDIIQANSPSGYYDFDAVANFADLSAEPWISRLVNPGLLKHNNGKIYALPQESSSFFGAAYYNKKVFADLGLSEPKTYAEFLKLLETIKTKGKGIIPFYGSNKDPWTTQIFMTLGFSVALYPNDKDVYSKLLTNKLKWTDVPEFKTVLTDYQNLYQKGYVNKDNLSANYEAAKEAVATGKAAMMLNGEWTASDILAKWPDVQLGAFIIPFGDKQIMGSGAYVQGFVVPKASKNPEHAKEFLNIWSQPKYQNMLWKSSPGFPGFKDVDGGKTIPAVKALVDKYIATGKFTYQINDPMGIVGPAWPDLWNYYVELVSGAKTPDQVLQAWQKKYVDFMKSKQVPGF